ncbi:unnamed protein product [Protopolystoma xenopodis]|uniref:Uncharacterized protein n=1 Tax=Protopolystoma xenopodis TaxID=117903 RepID=A0A448WHD8_9PLAT|nr:unnamed protein product [Protopolystoma xenopodis]
MVLRITKLIDDADYDAGETFGNVPRPRSDFGNDYVCNGLRARYVPLSLLTNMTKLRKQGQTTFKPFICLLNRLHQIDELDINAALAQKQRTAVLQFCSAKPERHSPALCLTSDLMFF